MLKRMLSEDSDYNKLNTYHYKILDVLNMKYYRGVLRAWEEFRYKNGEKRCYFDDGGMIMINDRITYKEFVDYIEELESMGIVGTEKLYYGGMGVKKLINFG